jgi:hypothetical protein
VKNPTNTQLFRDAINIFKVVVGFILLILISSYVPVSAVSPSGVIIAYLQTSGATTGTASEELIGLYNASSQDIEISNWCVSYSAAGNGNAYSKLACIDSGSDTVGLWLEAGSYMYLATAQYTATNGLVPDISFSAGMAATGGHLKLVDASGLEQDRVGWGTAVVPEGSAVAAHSAGKALMRKSMDAAGDTDNNAADFVSTIVLSLPLSGLYEKLVVVDVCPNLEGEQSVVPDSHYLVVETSTCEPILPAQEAPLIVTELYPNAPSYDTGQEFIELYNPNEQAVELEGYVLAVGPSFEKQVELSAGVVEPYSYIALSDEESGVVLPNTSASVQVITPAGSVVSESAPYSDPDEDESWALLDGLWSYTNQLSPGQDNLPSVVAAKVLTSTVSVESTTKAATKVLAPCGAGKVRNPETNRCRNIEAAATKQLVACDANEYRNPETNRCKAVATASAGLVPCKEGQERNPETTRCRKIAQVAGLAIIGACVYVTLEWRHEIARRFNLTKLSLGNYWERRSLLTRRSS